jgi:hypothetical protein
MSDLPAVPDAFDDDVAPVSYDPKEIGYQLWAYVCGRNATRTARLLQDGPGYKEGCDRPAYPNISARTVRDWVTRYHWAERFDRDMKRIAPGIHSQITQELIIGSVEAVQYARQVVAGEIAADKVRLDAAKTFLDRAGFMPWLRPADNSRPTGPVRDYSQSAAGLDEQELLDRLFGPKE